MIKYLKMGDVDVVFCDDLNKFFLQDKDGVLQVGGFLTASKAIEFYQKKEKGND